jgi:hypothetical protein
MFKKLMIIILSAISTVAGICASDKTQDLRNEVLSHTNPHITRETHPIVYGLVEELADRSQAEMPRYITTYPAEGLQIGRNGVAYRVPQDILAYVDAMGDLYICREILTDLSYDEIVGIIAIALSEQYTNRVGKAFLAGVGTFGATVALVWFLNEHYELEMGSKLWHLLTTDRSCAADKADFVEALAGLMIMPACLSASLVSNNLQKQVDTLASRVTSPETVVNGIKALDRIQDTYRKESIVSRIADKLQLKAIFNTLFYPVRAFTMQERVAYLQDISIDN